MVAKIRVFVGGFGFSRAFAVSFQGVFEQTALHDDFAPPTKVVFALPREAGPQAVVGESYGVCALFVLEILSHLHYKWVCGFFLEEFGMCLVFFLGGGATQWNSG